MQLLLSSDQLCVAAEDTVMFVAQQYFSSHLPENPYPPESLLDDSHEEYWEKIRKALAPLVRAPHLSLFALSCATFMDSGVLSKEQLFELHPYPLRSLLSLQQAAPAEQVAGLLNEHWDTFEDFPASWRLGPRHIRPLEGCVRLEWRLPVEQLKQACRDSFVQRGAVKIHSPESTPPMGGQAWELLVQCAQEDGGTVVGLYAGPQLSDFLWWKCKYTALCNGVTVFSDRGITPKIYSRGVTSICGLAPMAAGGWDDAVWAAAGLPTAGEILLELHVYSVG
jgi:hypothetical protein